jgi:hypothetical protein
MSRYTILKKSVPFKIRWDSLIKKKGYTSVGECIKDDDVGKLWSETGDVTIYNSFQGTLTCGCGKKNSTVKFLRQNTQYADDYRNYIIACPDCFEEIQAEWE